MRMVHDVMPRNHVRNVITGSEGSSVSGTTSATSSISHVRVSSEEPPLVFSAMDSRLVWVRLWKQNKTKQLETRDSALSLSSPLLNSYPRKGRKEERKNRDSVFPYIFRCLFICLYQAWLQIQVASKREGQLYINSSSSTFCLSNKEGLSPLFSYDMAFLPFPFLVSLSLSISPTPLTFLTLLRDFLPFVTFFRVL